jgi:Domain of unknown function (DUF4287)
MSFQGYLNTIEAKTGKDPAALRSWADGKGLSKGGMIKPTVKAGEVVAAAREDLGLGHGHAMAIFALLKGHKQEGDS